MMALAGGCASVAIVDPLESTGRITTTAAHALFSDKYELVDLIEALDPERRRAQGRCAAEVAAASTSGAAAGATKPADDEFGAALRSFYCYRDLETRRNRLQDELLWRSENRCTIYKNYLKRVESTQGVYTGVLATILGGVGAITKDIARAQLHSGLAAMSSGVGAELKQGFFSDVAVSVLVPGIDERRRQLLGAIMRKRSPSAVAGIGGITVSVDAYTMEAALRDVAEYHGACSILAGLDYAKDSIREVRNPGIATMNQTLASLRVTAKLLDPKASVAEIEAERIEFGGAGLGSGVLRAAISADGGLGTERWARMLGSLSGTLNRLETRVTEQSEAPKVAAGKENVRALLAREVKDSGGNQKGCGTAWLRDRVNEEFKSVLSAIADNDKKVLLAHQQTRLAAGEESEHIHKQAELQQALGEATAGLVGVERYYLLRGAAARNTEQALAIQPESLTDAVIHVQAASLKAAGQIELATGKNAAAAKACP